MLSVHSGHWLQPPEKAFTVGSVLSVRPSPPGSILSHRFSALLALRVALFALQTTPFGTRRGLGRFALLGHHSRRSNHLADLVQAVRVIPRLIAVTVAVDNDMPRFCDARFPLYQEALANMLG